MSQYDNKQQFVSQKTYVRLANNYICCVNHYYVAKTLKQFAYFMFSNLSDAADMIAVKYNGKTYGFMIKYDDTSYEYKRDDYIDDYQSDVDEIKADIANKELPEIKMSPNVADLIEDDDIVELSELIIHKDNEMSVSATDIKMNYYYAKKLFNRYRDSYKEHAVISDYINKVYVNTDGEHDNYTLAIVKAECGLLKWRYEIKPKDVLTITSDEPNFDDDTKPGDEVAFDNESDDNEHHGVSTEDFDDDDYGNAYFAGGADDLPF